MSPACIASSDNSSGSSIPFTNRITSSMFKDPSKLRSPKATVSLHANSRKKFDENSIVSFMYVDDEIKLQSREEEKIYAHLRASTNCKLHLKKKPAAGWEHSFLSTTLLVWFRE